jgi:hypothetical protein
MANGKGVVGQIIRGQPVEAALDTRRQAEERRHEQEMEAIGQKRRESRAANDPQNLWELKAAVYHLTEDGGILEEALKDPKAVYILDALYRRAEELEKAPIEAASEDARILRRRGVEYVKTSVILMDFIVRGEEMDSRDKEDSLGRATHELEKVSTVLRQRFWQKARNMAREAIHKEPSDSGIYRDLYEYLPEGKNDEVKYVSLMAWTRQWLAKKSYDLPLGSIANMLRDGIDRGDSISLIAKADLMQVMAEVGELARPKVEDEGRRNVLRGLLARLNERYDSRILKEIRQTQPGDTILAEHLMKMALMAENSKWIEGTADDEAPRRIPAELVLAAPEAFRKLHREGYLTDKEFRKAALSGHLGMKAEIKAYCSLFADKLWYYTSPMRANGRQNEMERGN